ncbi:hypothetical protein J4Q44_G00281540 [Coregonus suidteri]|uniref:Uncharacterized protein n=1 Tax=Coregonus suidteri TaxID=861788 RepID=A0AAN8LJP3_9TELE
MAAPAMVIPCITCIRPTAFAAPEGSSRAARRMDDPFVMFLYNMHLRICAQEEENVELKKKCYQLHTEVLREERVVQRAEEVRENEDNLPKLETVFLAKEERLDQCTGLQTTIIDKAEELRPKGDEVFDRARKLQATWRVCAGRWSTQRRWRKRHMGSSRGTRSSMAAWSMRRCRCLEETKEQKEVVLEEATKEEKADFE